MQDILLSPTGTQVTELTSLAAQNMDVFPPRLYSPAAQNSTNSVMLTFSEAVELTSAQTISNYFLQNFSNCYTPLSMLKGKATGGKSN